MNRNKRKVLVIGWDAADWKAINPLLDAGLMPNLEKMVNEGVVGNLATLNPPLSPMLWTTVATGKRPYKHGILGFTEVSPEQKVRPVTILHRKVKAIWNMLTQEGLKTHVVGWWPSHPAEPINGVCVSNFFQKVKGKGNEPWPIAEGTVHPADQQSFYANMRLHPSEFTEAHLGPFVGDFKKANETYNKQLNSIAKILADCSSLHTAMTYILEEEEWDFAGIYLDAIDHFKHGFMKFHPPRRPHVPEELYDMFKDVVTAGYRYHDMMLGRLLDLAGPDATVMLISDHGFHPDHLRPASLPMEPAGPAAEHSPYGIFCLKGPGIKKDELIFGASLLDITPTLLHLFGLPIGEDMDGKPLLNVYEKPQRVQTIPSWETREGESGQHPDDLRIDDKQSLDKESLDQLVELGYIEDPGDDLEKASMKTLRENRFYLAKAYIDGGQFNKAIEELEDLVEEHPDQFRYGALLVRTYLKVANVNQARITFDRLLETIRTTEKKEDEKRKQAGLIADRKLDHGLALLEAAILQAENKAEEALGILNKVESGIGQTPTLHLRKAQAQMQLKQWKQAFHSLQRQLEVNPESVEAHHGLGLCHLKMGQPDKALDPLLKAIGLQFHLPFAHYHLGEANFQLGNLEEAEQAFRVCLKMAPQVNKARLRLARTLEAQGKDAEAAQVREQIAANTLEGPPIYVVSGLPRSGTSLMMQILEKAGIPIFSDAKRNADENNPLGYYEHEAVKNLAKESQWVGEAQGQAIKVISHLVPHLPAQYRYKILFMERDLDEVLQSQSKMLERLGKAKSAETLPLGLKEKFEKNLRKVKAWTARNPMVETLEVQHRDLIQAPRQALTKVIEFLEVDVEEEDLAQVVDPNLYRSKK
jgi:predicted AlkP superfamily phosphohydrolase/phosphomutase/tetratricopeptide (TPR) repeat protein